MVSKFLSSDGEMFTFAFLDSRDEISRLIEWHNEHSDFVVLDFETTSKDPLVAQLIHIQISGRTFEQAGAMGTDIQAAMFDAKHLDLLKALKVRQVWQNFKYDWKVAFRHGLDFRGKPMHDTMLIDHLVDENRSHDLDSIVQEKYGDDYKARFWKQYKSYQEAPFSEQLDYACRDIVYTARHYRDLLSGLDHQKIPTSLVEHVHRLALALFDTEVAGIRVDLDYTIQMGGELKGGIVASETKLRGLADYHVDILELEAWANEIDKHYKPGPRATKWRNIERPEFNFASSGQVSTLLYDRLMLPEQLNRKTKKRTVDDDALEKLGDKHAILPELRNFRKLSKMYGAFVEGILDRAKGDRVYAQFNVNGTVTGRISHSDPNMGQMPSRGDWVKIRGIFVPDEGHKLITCDYGMLEVVIAAHFSQDPNLLKIIHEGASKHDITAENLGIPRSTAKTLNFAQQYLCTPRKVAEIVGCSKSDGEYYWNKYWETYAGERKVVDECKAKVDRGEPIRNPFGRLRRFPTQFATPWEKEAAYRQAYSSLIQGTGGDLTSWAFYGIAEELKQSGWGRAWFTIHDEVLAQAKKPHIEDVRNCVQSYMIEAGRYINLSVPLTVDCSGPLDRWTK